MIEPDPVAAKAGVVEYFDALRSAEQTQGAEGAWVYFINLAAARGMLDHCSLIAAIQIEHFRGFQIGDLISSWSFESALRYQDARSENDSDDDVFHLERIHLSKHASGARTLEVL